MVKTKWTTFIININVMVRSSTIVVTLIYNNHKHTLATLKAVKLGINLHFDMVIIRPKAHNWELREPSSAYLGS